MYMDLSPTEVANYIIAGGAALAGGVLGDRIGNLIVDHKHFEQNFAPLAAGLVFTGTVVALMKKYGESIKQTVNLAFPFLPVELDQLTVNPRHVMAGFIVGLAWKYIPSILSRNQE
jgi:hypothetical protein